MNLDYVYQVLNEGSDVDKRLYALGYHDYLVFKVEGNSYVCFRSKLSKVELAMLIHEDIELILVSH